MAPTVASIGGYSVATICGSILKTCRAFMGVRMIHMAMRRQRVPVQRRPLNADPRPGRPGPDIEGGVLDADPVVVVYQYIQHKMIAKDFANYLALYYKYKQDYAVETFAAVYTLLERSARQWAQALNAEQV